MPTIRLSDLQANQLAMRVCAFDANASEFLIHLDDASPSAGQSGRIPACLLPMLIGFDDTPERLVGQEFVLTEPSVFAMRA